MEQDRKKYRIVWHSLHSFSLKIRRGPILWLSLLSRCKKVKLGRMKQSCTEFMNSPLTKLNVFGTSKLALFCYCCGSTIWWVFEYSMIITCQKSIVYCILTCVSNCAPLIASTMDTGERVLCGCWFWALTWLICSLWSSSICFIFSSICFMIWRVRLSSFFAAWRGKWVQILITDEEE